MATLSERVRAEIVEQIYAELSHGAGAQGIRFDDEQAGLIKQALSDCVLETLTRAQVERLRPLAEQLHALAIRAFTKHGNDAELYSGIEDCADTLAALAGIAARAASAGAEDGQKQTRKA